MKVKIEYIVLIIAIAVLSIFLFARNKNKTHYDLPEIPKINEKDITKIILQKAGTVAEIIKENDNWFISKEKFPADKSKVDAIIKEISGLTLSALVSESKNYSIYELDDNNKTILEALSGDKLLLKIDIGKTASSYRHSFVKLEKDHKVYHANGNLKNVFDKKISDLRDKTVMRFDENISEIILNDSKKEMKILKKAAEIKSEDGKEQKESPQASTPEWLTDKNEKVKQREVETIVNTLKNLTCDDFVTDKIKDDFKEFIYSIVLKGNKNYSISIAEKKNDKYIAVSSENAYPFFLPEWRVKNLMKELDTILDNDKQKNK